MKISECYIENFGKLKSFNKVFDEGLNVIAEDNGFGKTTFAAFLQAMFYGLDAGRSKDSDRKKYDPWQGGKFGGSLCFEVNGKSYRMERFFGKKEKDDTFVLYDAKTGLESKDYSENIGSELFKIDKESFGKSAYIPQGKVEAELSKAGDINAKLSDLLETDNDLASFDDAMDNLKKLKNKYKRTGGLIPETEKKKSELEAELKEKESLSEVEFELKEKISVKKASLKGLSVKIEKLHQAAAKREKAEHYKTLKKDAEASEAKIKGYEDSLKKMPSETELSELKELTEEYIKTDAMRKASELSIEEQAFLENEIINIDTSEYDALRKDINEYKAKKKVIESAGLSLDEKEKLAFLKSSFENKIPSTEELTEINYSVRKAKELLVSKDEAKANLIPYILSALLAIIGVALFFSVSKTVGAIAFATGIILAVTYFIICSSKSKSSTKEKEEALSAIEKAKEFFALFGVELTDNCDEAFRKTQQMLTDMHNLESKKKDAETFSENSGLDTIYNEIVSKLKLYVGEVVSLDDAEEKLSLIYKKSEEAKRIYEKKKNYEGIHGKATELYGKLFNIAETYGKFLPERAYEELNTIYLKYTEEKKVYEAKNLQLKEFIKANGVIDDEIEVYNTAELDASKEAAEELDKEIRILEARLRDIVSETEKIPEITSELSDTCDVLEQLKKKADLIEKAENALQKSKDNIAAKYIGPLGEKFNEFKELLSAPINAKIDAELNVSVIEGGEQHSSEAYSSGLKDAMALALRFALIGALFEEEKPVVVMDDPFTNLDKNRIEKAKKMLEEVAKEYQILYLTCHESRT